MSVSFYESLGAPILITKQAFLISIPLAIMLVAHRMLVSLFLNFDIMSFFYFMVISAFLPSSYFLAAMIPTVKGLRYSDYSEVKSEA
jgi:hypothetical protein